MSRVGSRPQSKPQCRDCAKPLANLPLAYRQPAREGRVVCGRCAMKLTVDP